MRIMQIVSGTAVNGAVVNSLAIARGLRDRGHVVHMVCRPKSWISRQLRHEHGITRVECDLKRRWDRLRSIANIVRDQRIDVVHTHMSSANFFGIILRRLFGVPCVIATAHNRNVQLHWMFNDRVIAVSQATRKYQHRVNRVRYDRIDVVHNFVDPHRYQTITREAAMVVRDQLKIARGRKLIGVIGDVVPRKGQIHLVRAMPKILRDCPDAHLLCVGHWKDGFTEKFQREAQRLGVADHVTWSEAREDIGRVLKTLDVFVLPSLEENLPLTILEAMASELPVVATAVGGIPECIVDGHNGFLVPRGDQPRLAEAVLCVLLDGALARRMGAAGRQRVLTDFSLPSQIVRIERVFQKAIGTSSRGLGPASRVAVF